MEVWMEKEDRDIITKHLNKEDIMLEWGSGGSTLYFSKYVKEYYSIEHNKEWYLNVKKEIEKQKRLNIHLFYVPNDEPITKPTHPRQFKTYIKFINTLGYKTIDKVLIDGRARQWCAQEVLPYLTQNSLVFIHDWVRHGYHWILQWYTEIEKSKSEKNSTGVLKRKC